MSKHNKNFTIGSNSYMVKIEVIPNLYTKLQIFENSIDITNSIMSNQPLFNELLGSMSLPKLHHTTPKFLLENWKDSNNFFHEIIIEKNSSNISFKSDLVINEKKKIKKHLHPKFSGLHKYTFNFDNRIVIFEGSFINLVEKYIDSILDYINLIDNNLDNNQKIKDIQIPFNGKNINFTEIIVQGAKKVSINDTIIDNINSLDIRGYNRVISNFYMNCLFHYTSIDDHKLFFKNIYDCFNKYIPIHGVDKTIYMYFFEVSNQTERELEKYFGKGYNTGYLKAPDQYKFPISEIWKIQTQDENDKFNTIIPISPDYAILISSNNDTFENFKRKINSNSFFLEAFIENQLKVIDLQSDKFKESEDRNNIINKEYSILCPDLNTLNMIKTYIQNKQGTFKSFELFIFQIKRY
jgi:hypothetical protein